MSVLVHDKARRFITLVDELYDSGTTLIWTGETEPQQLFSTFARIEDESRKIITSSCVYNGYKTVSPDMLSSLGTDHRWKADQPVPLGVKNPQSSVDINITKRMYYLYILYQLIFLIYNFVYKNQL